MTDLLDLDESLGESAEFQLCKELLGEDVDYEEHPQSVFERMNDDRKEIAEKYGFPLTQQGQDYKEYAQKLIDLAGEKGVPILYVDKSRLESSNNTAAGHTASGEIVVPRIDFETSTPVEIYNWSVRLGHELIHSLQDPNMPIEKAEYEAYVATYLPTAYGIAFKEVGGIKGYLMYFRIVDNVLGLIKDSCLYNYKKKGMSPNQISWMRGIRG